MTEFVSTLAEWVFWAFVLFMLLLLPSLFRVAGEVLFFAWHKGKPVVNVMYDGLYTKIYVKPMPFYDEEIMFFEDMYAMHPPHRFEMKYHASGMIGHIVYFVILIIFLLGNLHPVLDWCAIIAMLRNFYLFCKVLPRIKHAISYKNDFARYLLRAGDFQRMRAFYKD